jgi:hypothetical protein
VAYGSIATSLYGFEWWKLDPNVAKVGGIQSQGAKGAAVVSYCKPLATPDLEPSGFPDGPLPRGPKGQKDGEKPNRSWNAALVYSGNKVYSCF